MSALTAITKYSTTDWMAVKPFLTVLEAGSSGQE